MPPSRTNKSRGGGGNLWAAYRMVKNGGSMGGRSGGSSKPPPAPKTFKKVEADFSRERYGGGTAPDQWDEGKLDAPNVDTVKFGSDFSIDDTVLEKLIARPSLCARLTTFIAGDPETGSGSAVHEEAFIRFIKLCPKMRLMALDSHGNLGKNSLLAILQSCPKLEALKITGHDRSCGKINDDALIALATACEADASLASKLRELNLVDQHVYEKGIKKLQKVRHLLIIRTGQTPRNHAYAGNGSFETYKGGKMTFGAGTRQKYAFW